MSIFNVSSKIHNTAVLVSSLSQVKMYITIVKDKVDVNMHDAAHGLRRRVHQSTTLAELQEI